MVRRKSYRLTREFSPTFQVFRRFLFQLNGPTPNDSWFPRILVISSTWYAVRRFLPPLAWSHSTISFAVGRFVPHFFQIFCVLDCLLSPRYLLAVGPFCPPFPSDSLRLRLPVFPPVSSCGRTIVSPLSDYLHYLPCGRTVLSPLSDRLCPILVFFLFSSLRFLLSRHVLARSSGYWFAPCLAFFKTAQSEKVLHSF